MNSQPPRETDPEPASKTRLRLWLRLLKASRRIEDELRDRLRTEFGTTLPRFDVMAALDRSGVGLKMSEISGVLRVSNGNVTGIVDKLVESGSALREQVPGDRRAALVRLTKKGRDEFVHQAEAHERWIDQLLHDVEPDRAVCLSSLLEDIAATSRNRQ